MDPVTHFLTGACLARSGFNRKAAYATLAMTLAAEMPDIDVLWSLRGPIAGFEHHRGVTHTLIGVPVQAAIVVAAMWAIDRRLQRPAGQRGEARTATEPGTHPPIRTQQPPARWGVLYGCALVALLSHLLLDWTNNYGVRPFFPFNPRWYAGSFVFIIDPFILFFLAAALLAPPLFALVAGEVGARRKPFRGRGWAVAALLAIVSLWGLRYIEHYVAVQLATDGSYGPRGAANPELLRVTANPSPADPFLWHSVAETPAFYQMARVDTRRGVVETDPGADILYKPPATAATLAAQSSWLGRVYLDWSSWPLVTEVGPAPLPSAAGPGSASAAAPNSVTTEVTFRDLRFLYDVPTRDWRSRPPLGAEVFVDQTQPGHPTIAAMLMNGVPQK